jgi:hypothetical protein
MKTKIFALAFAGALALAVVGGALAVGPGATVTKACPVASCNFGFWDGNGTFTTYAPTAYQDIQTPSGNETEVFKGTIANDTGHAVIYNSTSGAPVPAGQTCASFVTPNTTTDWQMTISASGNFSLVCHFAPSVG